MADTNMDIASLMAQLEAAKAENAALKAQGQKIAKLTCKVAVKSGGLSVFGLQRFPVTLYREQWERLLGAKDEILAFIKAHDRELKVKAPASENETTTVASTTSPNAPQA